MRVRFYTLLFSLLMLVAQSVSGQEISTSISRDSIAIGDTTHVDISVWSGPGAEIFFSMIPDTLGGGLELWAPPALDTLEDSEDAFALRLHLEVTGYDSGWYVIPRIPVLVRHYGNVDTLFSDGGMLHVSFLAKDEGVEDIYSIRPPEHQGVTFADVWPWLLALLLLLVAGVAVYLYRRRVVTGKSLFGAEAKKVSPEIVALDRLRRLREQKAWVEPGVKYFYTEVADVMREYLFAVWGIKTFECTTKQIVEQLKRNDGCQSIWIKDLKGIFELADLTKFARFNPTESDSLYTLDESVRLVNEIFDSVRVEDAAQESEVDAKQVDTKNTGRS